MTDFLYTFVQELVTLVHQLVALFHQLVEISATLMYFVSVYMIVGMAIILAFGLLLIARDVYGFVMNLLQPGRWRKVGDVWRKVR